MRILPIPKQIEKISGDVLIVPDMPIVISADGGSNELYTAQIIQDAFLKICGMKLHLKKGVPPKKCIYLKHDSNSPDQGYHLAIQDGKIELSGNSAGIFYAAQTLKQLIEEYGVMIPCVRIIDAPDILNRGIYYDVTRGRVPKLETLMHLADRLARYKINQMQLYVEHTFAYQKMSEVWRGADPLLPEDILLLDKYCQKRHIELVPSFSSFGHLYHLLASKSYEQYREIEEEIPYSWIARQIHHTIDASNPKSIELIGAMIQEVAPLFSGKHFNICCDETFDMGEGRSKETALKQGKGTVYSDFLSKLCDVVEQTGKIPMFWGDVVVNYPEQLSKIPKNAICLTWGYDRKSSDKNCALVAKTGRRQYICGGTSGWNRLLCDYSNAWENLMRMSNYAIEYQTDGFLNTDWGDMGHVNCLEGAMSLYVLSAALSWNRAADSSNYAEMISQAEYGQSDIVKFLKEIGDSQIFNWADLVSWMEQKKGYSPRAEDVLKPWTDREFFLQKSDAEVYKACNAVERAYQELIVRLAAIRPEKRSCMQEILVAAKGILFLNQAFLIIKKREYAEETELLIMPETLAEKIELWFSEFEAAWREKNRESELYRIRDTVFYLCDYLREATV